MRGAQKPHRERILVPWQRAVHQIDLSLQRSWKRAPSNHSATVELDKKCGPLKSEAKLQVTLGWPQFQL